MSLQDQDWTPLTSTTSVALQFFDLLFTDTDGYLCICTGDSRIDKKGPDYFKQDFFKWPEERAKIGAHIEHKSMHHNVWYCTSLLDAPKRAKERCLPGSIVWADLDTCRPDLVSPPPSVVIESSPHRYQAIWRLEDTVEPYIQEDYAKRIAYKFSADGVDTSGWDLTQLLRVPGTYNFKYGTVGQGVPEIHITSTIDLPVPTVAFDVIERPIDRQTTTAEASESLPDLAELPSTETIIYKYYTYLEKTPFTTLWGTEPPADADWSATLWRLINILFESGMSKEEVFVLAITAKCNKYSRDNRPAVHLWEEVLRAEEGQKRLTLIFGKFEPLVMPRLVDDEEIESCGLSFVDEYKQWAVDATDAVPEFHELAAFILLSAVVASGVSLKTSYGEMVPNLWGLILGDSTLSRKTTAMRMAMDMLPDIDNEIILATDGSAEGLLSGLSTRPNQTSIFFKDEVSGFINSINKKDYLAGMPEVLTQLYDVPKVFTRRLRKETISINSPVFIFFGGGIKDKLYSLIDEEYILSGFLPRFLIVSGSADLSRIRRTGPGDTEIHERKEVIHSKIRHWHSMYNQMIEMQIGGEKMEVPAKFNAILTEEAWARYGIIEDTMVQTAHASPLSMLALPTFERMSRSLLKMSVLLASTRNPPSDRKVLVEERDVVSAAGYIQRWGRYSVDMLVNSGKSSSEKTLNKILTTITKHNGVTKSIIMQHYHLSSREATEIINTLVDRGQITTEAKGRGMFLRPVL